MNIGSGRYGTNHPLDIELERLLKEDKEAVDPKWWQLRKTWKMMRRGWRIVHLRGKVLELFGD